MGYTHHYRYSPEHPSFRDAWPQMVTDAQRIVDRVQDAGVIILGFDGIPPVSATGIAFGGDYTQELTAESFIISPSLERLRPWHYNGAGVVQTFCKTERYPYDLAVTAILLRCRSIAPDAFFVSSDGDWDDDWSQDATHPPTGLSTRGVVTELFGDYPTASPFNTGYF
jgi:hypothetical protein